MKYKNLNSFVEVEIEYLDQKIKENLSTFGYYEYEDEKNGTYVYEIKNKDKEKNLLIVVDAEATVYYADSHSHYAFYKNEIDELIKSVLNILDNEMKVVKFYSSRRWLGDFWIDTTEKVDGIKFLENNNFPKEFINEIKRLGGTITETYWSKEKKTYTIEPEKKNG